MRGFHRLENRPVVVRDIIPYELYCAPYSFYPKPRLADRIVVRASSPAFVAIQSRFCRRGRLR